MTEILEYIKNFRPAKVKSLGRIAEQSHSPCILQSCIGQVGPDDKYL